MKKLIQNLCILGLNDNLIPLREEQNYLLTSIELHTQPQQTFNTNEKWLLLSSKLFLRAIFNENKKPITNVKKVEVEIKDNQILFQYKDYQLCTLNQVPPTPQSINIKKDLGENHPDIECLSICYTRKMEYNPIINLVLGQNIENENECTYNSKQLYITRRESPLNIPYQAQILDLYPFQYKNSQKKKYQNPINNSILLPKLCFPEGVILKSNDEEIKKINPQIYLQILKDNNGNNIYLYCLRFYENAHTVINKKLRIATPIFTPLVVCLIASQLYTRSFYSLLDHIYRKYTNNQGRIQLESYIVSFIEQIQDQCIFQIEPDLSINFSYSINAHAISYLFNKLDSESIITLYTCLLAERKILLVSEDMQGPALIIEALNILLYPMEFLKVTLPILPEDMYGYLESPESFIIGKRKNLRNMPRRDADTVEINLDGSIINNLNPLPILPNQLKIKLSKILQKFQGYKSTEIILNSAEICDIRNAFFRLNLKLLQDIDKFYQNDRFLVKRFQETKTKKYQSWFDRQYNNAYMESFWERFSISTVLNYFVNQRKQSQEFKYKHFDQSLKQKQKQLFNFFLQENKIELPVIIFKISEFQWGIYKQFPTLTIYKIIENKNQWVLVIQRIIYALWFKILFILLHFQIEQNNYQNLQILLKNGIYILEQMQTDKIPIEEWIIYQFYEWVIYEYPKESERFINMFHYIQFDQIYPQIDNNDLIGINFDCNQMQDIENFEYCQILFENKCKCNRQISVEEILYKFNRNYFGLNQIKCSPKQGGCGSYYSPIMQINNVCNKNMTKSLLNPLILDRQIEYVINAHSEQFIFQQSFFDEYQELFWNIAMYFKLLKLPVLFFIDLIIGKLSQIQLTEHLQFITISEESSSSGSSSNKMKQDSGYCGISSAFSQQIRQLGEVYVPQTKKIQIN